MSSRQPNGQMKIYARRLIAAPASAAHLSLIVGYVCLDTVAASHYLFIVLLSQYGPYLVVGGRALLGASSLTPPSSRFFALLKYWPRAICHRLLDLDCRIDVASKDELGPKKRLLLTSTPT